MNRRAALLAVLLTAAVGWRGARADVAKAMADFKAGRYVDAAAEMQAVVDRVPAYDFGYFLIGHCMLKMHHAQDAEKQFRRAIEIDPTRSEYYQGLAMALKAEADWKRTIEVTTEGLERAQDPATRFNLLKLRGFAWGALQQWGRSVRDLEAARRIKPEPNVLAMLGNAYFSIGAYGAAVPPLVNALRSAPDDPTLLRLLGESYIRAAAGDPDAARKRLEYLQSLDYAQRLASIVPNDLEAVNLVGRAALGSGRLDQAESVFLHVLAHDPRQCYAMINLGRTYFAGGRWSEAEAFLKKAAACAPRTAVIYETLGELYLKRGLTQDAAEAFRRAEEIDPARKDAGGFDREPRNPPDTVPVSGPR